MTRIRARGEEVRRFILENIEEHPEDITKVTAEHFKISRQAVNLHLQKLVREQALVPKKEQHRHRSFKLAPLIEWRRSYPIAPDLDEDVVWRNDVSFVLGPQPENVLGLWQYGFTEMFNNAKDHSSGTVITVVIKRTAATTEMLLIDNGIGIFRKIQAAMKLLDERHAILELAKGKFTTDPKHHTGEGIFFSSRMFDSFDILSGNVFFTRKFGDSEDWIMDGNFEHGTAVWMKLGNHTARTMKSVFLEYAPEGDGDFGFTKTVVPVRLIQYGNDMLISRSQAKRLLARIELFKTVLFDFSGVETIGQSFADEIFRVFARQHEEISLIPINTTPDVERMINRAYANAASDEKAEETAKER